MIHDTGLTAALDRKDFAALEEEWLRLVAEAGSSLQPFLTAADGMERLGQPERAGPLLELLDQALQEQNLWPERLELLRAAGRRFVRTGRVHETVIETIERCYADREAELRYAMAAVGLDKAKDETPKLWDKVDRLRALLQYCPGLVVAMAGKGVGRIVEVNVELQTLKIDFERHRAMAVGLRAAGKLLEVLPEGHLLRRKLENPQELEALTPAALLQQTLQSYGRPLTGAEIREAVTGIVPETKWTSWWASVRKHPRLVATGSGSRATYTWADSAAEASTQLLDQLAGADTRGQIELLKRAVAQGDPELATAVASRLSDHAAEVQSRDPSAAFEAWVVLEKLGDPPWRPHDHLATATSPDQVLDGLSTRVLRERAYTVLREAREDWRAIFERRFLFETDPRLLGFLIDTLRADGNDADTLLDRVLSQPAKSPDAFAWLAAAAVEDATLQQRYGLRLLRQILRGIGDDSFSAVRARLMEQIEPGGAVPRLIAALDKAGASEAAEAVRQSRLAEHQRRPLLNALYLRYPELEPEREAPLYATPASLVRKREELRHLVEEEIPANRRAIEEARAMGDLRENFEYKSARQRHEYLSARAATLHGELARARPLEPGQIQPDQVRIGTAAELEPPNGGQARRLVILGPWESSPERGVLSYESELARLLLGRRPGDAVEVDGEQFVIARIETVTEA
ncbi:MAG TPA: GreA/GreB family elongation factor [Thermoanaerobaculia bacterium]|nr:GreA/GreB family elongation factor [Thermoanaerobaculia bacterium]